MRSGDLDGAPEGGEEGGRVEEEEKDPLLQLDAEIAQGIARAVDQFV